MSRRRTFRLTLAIIVGVIVATGSIAVATNQSNQQFTSSVSATTTPSAKPILCEVRNLYGWVVGKEPIRPSAAIQAPKGKSVTVVSSSSVERVLASSQKWCGPAGGELVRCDTSSCPETSNVATLDSDGTAVVKTSFSCSQTPGLTCKPVSDTEAVYELDATRTVNRSIVIANVSAACGTKTTATVSFALRSDKGGTTVTRVDTIPVTTEACPKAKAVVPPKPKAAPRPAPKPAKPQVVLIPKTSDYWQSHSALMGRYLPVSIGGGTHEPRVVSGVSEALDILSYGHSVDGIWRLAAQLVTAKLNIKSGSPVPTNACLSRGDALFDEHKYHVWRLLSEQSRQELNSCANSLAAYNGRSIHRP